MFPRDRRLRRSSEIGSVVRGRRAGTPRIVVHVTDTVGPARFGLAVNKAVGGSVQRHRVARRLRHRLADQITAWDELGCDVVVRALPPAATASSEQLAADLESCRRRLSQKGSRT